MFRSVLVRRYVVAGILVVGAPMLSVGTALAAGDKGAAKALADKAMRLYEIREYEKALEEYKSAYLAEPDPRFLYNIGQCYRKQGNVTQARNFFTEYLKKAPETDPNRAAAQKRLADLEAEEAKGQSSAVAAPPPVPVQPQPLPDAAPEPSPSTIESVPEPAAPAPASESSRGRPFLVAASATLGLASIGMGVYYYSEARTYSDRIHDRGYGTPAEWQAGRSAESMQWIFFSVGAAGVVAGTLMYLWPASDGQGTALAPMVGPGYAGVGARGAF